MNEFFDDVQQFASDNTAWLWVALAVLIALVVLGVLAAMWRSKKREWDRKHAAQIRREADAKATRIDAEDAEARRLEAQARQARAEADRIEANASEKRTVVEHERKEQAARLEEADKLDRGKGRDDHDHDSGYQGAHVKDEHTRDEHLNK